MVEKPLARDDERPVPTDEELANVTALFEQPQNENATDAQKIDPQTLPLPLPNDVTTTDAAAMVDLCLALMNTSEFIYLE